MLVMITAEGVLTDPTEPVATAEPLAPGVQLLNGFVRGQHQVLLMIEAEYTEELKVSLRARGVSGYVTAMSCPSWINYEAWRVTRVKEIRAMGWHPELFIDPSPSVCAKVLRDGVSTLLYTAATFTRSEWRPDFERTVRPWDEVVASIEEEQHLRAAHGDVPEVAGAVIRGV